MLEGRTAIQTDRLEDGINENCTSFDKDKVLHLGRNNPSSCTV